MYLDFFEVINMPIIIKVLFICVSIFGIIYPKKFWKITEGWKYKNAEPIDEYHTITRVGFVIILLVAIFA